MGWAKTHWVALSAGMVLCAIIAADVVFPPPLDRYRDQSVSVNASDGTILRAFLSDDDKWRLPAAPTDVDSAYLTALKAFEDKRFDRHWGVDPVAIARAVTQNFNSGRVVSGASTITMQAARLLEPRGRGWPAKIRQTLRALQLERRYTKDEVLSIYLTLAPFGGNIEGVRAASLSYFQKEPHRLSLSEIALLVALPQSPERLRPDRYPERAQVAQAKILRRLVHDGYVDQAAVSEARTDPVISARHSMPFSAPHLAQHLKAKQSFVPTIQTFVDRHVQDRLEELARREQRWFSDDGNLAFVVVHNESREVRAYVGGADYWGPAGQVDLVRAVRSPGSTLKPFIYGLAFDDMPLHPMTLIEDRPTLFGDYAPRNFSRNFQGTVTVSEALQWSLNVPAVALLDRLGPHRFHGALSRAGARLTYGGRHPAPSLPLALGGVGMRLNDLTQLYVALAQEGRVQGLLYAAGTTTPQEFRLLSKEASWYVTNILQGSPLPDGLAQGQGFERDRPIAFKTGTSYGFRDAWALGSSQTYTVGVWVGRADGSTRPGRYGRNEAAPLLMKVFDALPTEEQKELRQPPNTLHATSNKSLPISMRRFKPAPMMADISKRAPLQVMFPPNGAIVSLPKSGESGALALRSAGGALPVRWLVDGELLAGSGMRRRTYWTPQGAGFSRVTAIDAKGKSATSYIRLVTP